MGDISQLINNFDVSNMVDFQAHAEKIALYEPKPEIEPQPEYPLDALGNLLGPAAKAIAGHVQAPIEIAAQSILGAAALVAQSKANLLIDSRVIPLSLFCLTVAESGDRKTSCDKIAMQSVNQWQRDELTHYQIQLDSYEAALKSHPTKNSEEPSLADKPPIFPAITCPEPTLEGLQKGFSNGLPFQGLFSDEGGQFFGGHAMNPDNCARSIAGLSCFWDGSPINRKRAGIGESMVLFNRRLSIHLLAQPIITDKVLSDSLLQSQGILARFLITESKSLAGTRLYKISNTNDDHHIKLFHERMRNLLDEGFSSEDSGGLDLENLTLSKDAKKSWVLFYNEVEKLIGPGGELEAIKPTASKSAENVLRIAGVISVISGEEEVSSETMKGAIHLGDYYLRQALRITQIGNENEKTRNAQLIIEWITDQGGQADINTIQKSSPSKLGLRKSVKKTRTLLSDLVDKGWLKVTELNSHHEPKVWEVSNAES